MALQEGQNGVQPEHSGRLELTWTNKHLRLLANEQGGYTWVSPSDYRVAEVRLLHDDLEIGETRGIRSRAQHNLLIRGDALNALTSLCELPEFAREYVGKVKLVYLDPPFNTQQAFEHYDDALNALRSRPTHDVLGMHRPARPDDGNLRCADFVSRSICKKSFVRPRSYTRAVNWLAAYGFATDDTPARLGKPATLTVVLRDLDNDRRTYEFLPIEPAVPGEEQREAILRAMAGRFPDARWKTYNADKQIASFVGRQHLYIAIYEEHDVEVAPEERPTLFAI